MPNTAPVLTGLSTSATFLENTVNAAPQLLDVDVAFTDPDSNFDGGTLAVSGLLAEDKISIRNEGSAAGQIGFAAGTITYGGIAIGTATGGAGGTFSVTFNAAATAGAIDALLQNLTYANSSDTPVASRTLVIDVQDGSGAAVRGETPKFTPAAGGLIAGRVSAPALGDLDGDGDLDLVVGDSSGNLFLSTNIGGAFGGLVQIGTLNAGAYSGPALGDLDGDGDLDLVVGNNYGEIFTSINANGVFAAPVLSVTLPSGFRSKPALGDLDGDGDLDLVVGNGDGILFSSMNTGGAFGALAQIGVLDVGSYSSPALGDLDGDGDLDLVLGTLDGTLFRSTNDGGTFGALVEIGTSSVGLYSSPALGDIDGDGDLDLIVGSSSGNIHFFSNAPVAQITVHVTPGPDPATVSIADVSITEGSSGTSVLTFTVTRTDNEDAFTIDYASVAGTALGGSDFTAASGTLTFALGGALTQTVSITIHGDSALEADETFTVTLSNIVNTSGAATISDASATGTITNDDVNNAPVLSGLAASVTFGENAVNAAPQLLDVDVAFTDIDGNFNGGALRVSGLLAEDSVSIRNQGSAAGQIGFASGIVTYGGIAIGAVTGGAGGTLNVTFNAAATSDAIDALLQNLTYANSSDTPTASRTLTVDIRDAAGTNVVNTDRPPFTELTGATNPANGIDVGANAAPALNDLDDDGDLDLVLGSRGSGLWHSINSGTTAAPVFGALTGVDQFTAALVVSGIPAFSTQGGFGFLVAGTSTGLVASYYDGGGDYLPFKVMSHYVASPMFLRQPTGFHCAPALGDLNFDDHPDLVYGNEDGELHLAINAFGDIWPVFHPSTRIGTLDVGDNSTPALGDLDGDGDLDLVVGARDGKLYRAMNTGTVYNPVFVELTQIGDIDVGSSSTPVLGDIDGDGRLDLVVGSGDGTIHTFLNTMATEITINVTAEAELPVAQNDAFSTGETTPLTSGNIFADNGFGADSGSPLAITHINGAAFADGSTITLASGALLTVNADGTFSYNPNGKFQRLGAAGSGAIAADLTATDSFTYAVSGGDTATVTFIVTGVDNNDVLHGQSLAPLNGGNGNDRLYAHATNGSILNGEANNDLLFAGAGADALNGGTGIDYASYQGLSSVTAGLGDSATNTGRAAGDSYTGIEGLIGSSSSDTLAGNGGANILFGAGGDDNLFGAGGNDQLRGGAGADDFDGGAGVDTVSYLGAAAGVHMSLDGSVTATGDALGDTFTLIERFNGSAHNDIMAGDARANLIFGDAGNDDLRGRGGNDALRGGAGADTLSGGSGSDRYEYRALSEGGDTIADFGNAVGNNDVFSFFASAFGGGLAAGVALTAAQFQSSSASAAAAGAVRFIYDTDDGVLCYDSNGSDAGGVTVIATLTSLPALQLNDFIIV